MVLEDLACSGFQNGVHRVTVDIAIVKIFVLLTSDTGIDVSVTLQQENFLRNYRSWYSIPVRTHRTMHR